MADATVTLGLNAAQLTTGLRTASGQVNKFASGASASFSRLSASLGVLGGGFTLGAIVKQGFSFNQTMKDSEVAISNVLQQLAGLNSEASKAEAAKAMQQLIDLEPEAAGGLTDLVQGFMATVAAAQGVGISVDQNIKLVGKFANALANANLPVEQLGQEMRSILTQNIGADSSLAKILGITNEMVGKAREAGNLYEFLNTKIGLLGVAGDTAGVAFSTLNSALSKAAGALTADMFSSSVSGAKNLSAAVDANIKNFEYLGSVIGTVIQKSVQGIGLLAEFLQFNNAIGTGIGEALTGGSFMEGFKETMDGFKADAAKAAESATAQPGSGAAGGVGSGSGSSVTDTLEKQKRGTYDIAKNLQEQANAANSILAPYQQFLNFLDEAKRKQDGINQANKEARKNAQSQIESQKNAAQSLEDEIRMIDARATGDEKKIKTAERELAIKEKSRQIQQQLGLTADKATAIATAIQDAKDKAEGKESGNGRIMGYSWARQGGADAARGRAAQRRAEGDANRAAAYSRGFGGLNEFYRNQQDPNFARPVTPNLDRMEKNPASTSSPVVGAVQSLEQTIKALLTVD
jgi:hypothetical protein